MLIAPTAEHRYLETGDDYTKCSLAFSVDISNGLYKQIVKQGFATFSFGARTTVALFEKITALEMEMNEETGWIWSEPTMAELSDGRIAMQVRKNGGYLGYTESCDGEKTWCPMRQTDILNPSNKPKLIPMDKGRVALLHTPNNNRTRYPMELWISEDDMKTWCYQKPVTDFPGLYPYPDGFYEDGHIYFTVDYKRMSILFFDIELDT